MEQVVTIISNTGVAGLLAALLYLIWKGEREDATVEEERHRQQEEQMQKVIERNTASINRLSDILEKGGYKHE